MPGPRLESVVEKSIADAIERVVSSGEVDSITDLPAEVVAECARRYLVEQIARRRRGVVRSQERRAIEVEEVDSQILARMRSAAHDALTKTAIWTVELLESSFTLPSGETVRWGDATWHQHTERAASLEVHAAGTIQTAALHRQAASRIFESGSRTLREALQ